MDSFEGLWGTTTAQPTATTATGLGVGNQAGKSLNQKGLEERKAAVDDEISRVNKLPSNSTYAVHRLRVLNKILHLLSIQRTASQDEELESLFAGLSI